MIEKHVEKTTTTKLPLPVFRWKWGAVSRDVMMTRMLVIIVSPLILSRLPLLLLVLESTRRSAGPLIMRLPRDVKSSWRCLRPTMRNDGAAV